jgi:RNA polymerase sigma factor (sigma-70 family)
VPALLRDRPAAEDAAQATFLLLARKAGSLSRPEGLAAWLHGVAYRVALKVRVSEARRKSRERAAARPEAVRPSDGPLWSELRPVLDAAVAGLSEKYRVAVVLCYLEGRSHAEAARQLACPVGTVASRLARARELLRGRLARRGVTLSAGILVAALQEGMAVAVADESVTRSAEAALSAAAIIAPDLCAASTTIPTFLKGAFHAMFQSKYRACLTLLLGLGLCIAGTGSARQRLTASTRAEDGASAVGAADRLPERPDLEAQIYAALREKHVWKSPDARFSLWVRTVAGRHLSQVILKHFDAEGKAKWTAFAKEAELRVDRNKSLILVKMIQGEVISEKGDQRGYFEERTWEVPFPPDFDNKVKKRRASDLTWWDIDEMRQELLAEIEMKNAEIALPASMFGTDSAGPAGSRQAAEVQRVLEAAFGADAKEARRAAVKLLFRANGLVLAADRLTVEADGRIRCTPCWLVRPGPDRADGTRSLTAVRCGAAYLTLDRRVDTVADLAGRQVIGVEPTGDVRISFPP